MDQYINSKDLLKAFLCIWANKGGTKLKFLNRATLLLYLNKLMISPSFAKSSMEFY